jgi:hypothetical protein
MAIDLTHETLLTYRDAVRQILPTKRGKDMHIGTLHRWRVQGLRGARLDSIKVGGQWCTSLEALQRFFDSLSMGRQDQRTSCRTEHANPSVQASAAMHALRTEGF